LSVACQIEIGFRRGPRFLDEVMQQDYRIIGDTKHNARDPVATERGPYLSQAAAERPAEWHANRPPELDHSNVVA
jgi:hypothetical protein